MMLLSPPTLIKYNVANYFKQRRLLELPLALICPQQLRDKAGNTDSNAASASLFSGMVLKLNNRKPQNPSQYGVNIWDDDIQHSPAGCGVSRLCVCVCGELRTRPWVCLDDLPSRREQTHLCFDDSSTLLMVSGADGVHAMLSQLFTLINTYHHLSAAVGCSICHRYYTVLLMLPLS